MLNKFGTIFLQIYNWPIHKWSESCPFTQYYQWRKSKINQIMKMCFYPQPEYIALLYAYSGLSALGIPHVEFFNTFQRKSPVYYHINTTVVQLKVPYLRLWQAKVSEVCHWFSSISKTWFPHLGIVTFTAGNKSRVFWTKHNLVVLKSPFIWHKQLAKKQPPVREIKPLIHNMLVVMTMHEYLSTLLAKSCNNCITINYLHVCNYPVHIYYKAT
jgi:hypothetical protein